MEYYTDDITCLPAAVIWRTVRATGILGALPLFLFFLTRKLLGWRFAANYGSARLDSLPEVLWGDVPDDVKRELLPLVEDYERAGFTQMFFLRGEYIGNKEQYSSVLLDQSGLIYATVTWFRLTFGTITRSNLTISCHSQRRNGAVLTTGPLEDKYWHPELVPPFCELGRLPPRTPVADVIRSHRERITAFDDIVRFDRLSLHPQLLKIANGILDFMVEKGYFVKLTEGEVQRLSRR